MLGRYQPSARATLLALSAALLVPLLLFASYLLWEAADAERDRYEREARRAAERFMSAVDLEVTKMRVMAEALATSPHIAAGDFEAFRRQGLDALRVWAPGRFDDFAFILRDATGQQVANTRVPWGTPLPMGSHPETDEEVLRTRRPVVQGLFLGAISGRPAVAIRVPVVNALDEATHVLAMSITPDHFAEIASAQRLPPGWFIALLDGTDRMIARIPDHARFVGHTAPAEFVRAATTDGGVWTGVNLANVAIVGGYERSTLVGWLAFVGLPLSQAQAPLQRWLWLTAALGVLAAGASVVIALPFARTITGSVALLKAAASRVGEGVPIDTPRTSLRELDEVGRAITEASARLREREAALRASEGRLRATHENDGVGIVEIDASGRVVSVNDAECRIVGHAREALVGRHFLEATVSEDCERDRTLFERLTAGEFDLYNIEKRFVRGDGAVGWARVSCNAVRDAGGAFLYAVRIVEDITERVRAETRQKLLVDELNHRVKNTLATVQSLVAQTFRQDLPPEVARARFEARLMALSRTHNLLNETRWTSAPISRVLGVELTPYLTESPDRIRLSGPEVELEPRAAVVLGMVAHELATNAAKCGSLAAATGRVDVTWSLDGHRLAITWSERGGPPVTPPKRSGFGTRLIRQAVQGELDGVVTQTFRPEGLVCELAFPLRDTPAAEATRTAA